MWKKAYKQIQINKWLMHWSQDHWESYLYTLEDNNKLFEFEIRLKVKLIIYSKG